MALPEALRALCTQLGLQTSIDYDPDWSAAPDFLDLIVRHALALRPETLVECGSGVTTLMLARCCQINGTGHVHSLEHQASFAARTREALARHALSAYASVIDAPLPAVKLSCQAFHWYDLAGLTAQNIAMLVIDGPPGKLQPNARYPALPLLQDRLAEHCTVILDDAAREDERLCVTMWQTALPHLDHHHVALERGCSLPHTRSDFPIPSRLLGR